MQKLKELLEKNNTNEYNICKNTGLKGRTNNLEQVLTGERAITSLNLNILSAYARGLGVKLTDILDDYDLDGTTSQVLGIKRLTERLRRIKDGNTDYRENYQNGGFVLGKNLRKAVKDFPLKKGYEKIKPDKPHAFNTPEIYMLNNEYNHRHFNNYSTRNKTLLNISPKFNSKALCYIIYSPFENGGDLKIAVSVFDRNDQLMFSEIYGCEWLDKKDRQDIYYYKWYSNTETVTPYRIENSTKEMISELEFYQAFYSQLTKFNISY